MSFRRCRFRRWFGLFAIVFVGLAAGGARGQDKPADKALPAGDVPKGPEATGNPVRPVMRKNALMRLEEDLARSLGGFRPPPVLEGDTTPQQPRPRPNPVIPSKRAREQAERRKDWVFMNPDEPAAGLTIEEMFKVPGIESDGREVKQLSPLERFYQGLEQRYSAKTNAKQPAENDPFSSRKTAGSRNEAGAFEDANLPADVQDPDQNLRKLLGTDTPAQTPAPTYGTLSDIFGLGEQGRSSADEVVRKGYLKEYQRWMETPPVAAGTAPAGTALPTEASRGPMGYSSVPAVSGASRAPALAPLPGSGPVNPTLGPTPPSEVTAKVLNEWNPLYVPPKVELPKTPPPPPPPEPPRRKF